MSVKTSPNLSTHPENLKLEMFLNKGIYSTNLNSLNNAKIYSPPPKKKSALIWVRAAFPTMPKGNHGHIFLRFHEGRALK
jgi:hypothetical protein